VEKPGDAILHGKAGELSAKLTEGAFGDRDSMVGKT